jgi:hypothetical protein
MDSSVSPRHSEQESGVWNGHCDCTCNHPLFVFNQFGDLERGALRSGNVHCADIPRIIAELPLPTTSTASCVPMSRVRLKTSGEARL